MPKKDDSETPNLSLKVVIWGTQSNKDPRIEPFTWNEWDKAIDRARELSTGPEVLSHIQVVDAWGMLVAQFCHRSLYAPRHWSKASG